MAKNKTVTRSESRRKKILISYCQHDHEPDFIAELALKLQKDGFEVMWDKAITAPDDWIEWFEKNVDQQDFVFMVFSRRYKLCYESPDKYHANFAKIGSTGIIPEIKILKDIVTARAESPLTPERIISIFRSEGETEIERHQERRELVPKGLGYGKNLFGLNSKFKVKGYQLLVNYLKRDKPPSDFARRSWLSKTFGRIALVLQIVNECFSKTARAIGFLGLSGLLIGLTYCLYQFHEVIPSFFDVATLTQQETLKGKFSTTNGLLRGIDAKADQALAGLETHITNEHKSSIKEVESLVRGIENVVRDWSPALDPNSEFQQITSLQKSVTKLVTNQFEETNSKIEDLPSWEQLEQAFQKVGGATNESDAETFLACCKETDKKLAGLINQLTMVRQEIENIKINANSDSPNAVPSQEPSQSQDDESATFQSQQSWFFYNRAREHFFGGRFQLAVSFVDQGLAMGNEDGRMYYLRGLANRRSGFAFEDDFRRAMSLERENRPTTSIVNRSLERVQGNERMWLEKEREKLKAK